MDGWGGGGGGGVGVGVCISPYQWLHHGTKLFTVMAGIVVLTRKYEKFTILFLFVTNIQNT